MTEEDKTEDDSFPDPHIKERDKGIIEAFAIEDNNVLTNNEIAEHVSVHPRTVRRRLDDLADDGVIGQRVASGVKLAWLEQDVKEPITVQYPLLRYVWDRTSVALFVLGSAIGVIAVLILLAATLSTGHNVQVWVITPELLQFSGLLAAVISGVFIVVALVFAVVEWLLRYFEIGS